MAVSIVLERPFSSGTEQTRQSAQLKRRRIYILPTRHGYILAVVLFAMLLGAINYNNSMAYILTFLLSSILMICIVHTYRNLAGLIINTASPKAVFAGDTALFPMFIDNRDGPVRPALRALCSPENSLRRKRDRHKHQPVEFSLAAGTWQQVDIPVTGTQRGVLPLERVIISTTFPLGLFHAWSYLDLDSECVIYPKPEGQDPLPPPLPHLEQGESGDLSGMNDFAGFRQYHPGDSIRNIAWKAVARDQPLLVKRFSGDGGYTHMFTWNQVQHLHDTELRMSQLCLWLIHAEQQGRIYGLAIPNQHIEPGQGTTHFNRCLDILARY